MNSKPVVHGETRGTRKTARNPVIYRTSNKGPFRVQKNAASLKPVDKLDEEQTSPPFRVQKNAASLKHEEHFLGDDLAGTLPRSKERGLIEATRRWANRYNRSSFRVQKNAASLKLQFGHRSLEKSHADLPRSKERGLIEATTFAH